MILAIKGNSAAFTDLSLEQKKVKITSEVTAATVVLNKVGEVNHWAAFFFIQKFAFISFLAIYRRLNSIDIEECEIRCPPNITKFADTGVEFISVTWEQPDTMCNLALVSTRAPGSFFGSGPSAVTLMLLNNSQAVVQRCQFWVFIHDGECKQWIWKGHWLGTHTGEL